MRDLTEDELREALYSALAVPGFVDTVAAHYPLVSVEALMHIAYDAAGRISAAEIDEALAHHPRIGDSPVGDGAAQSFSRAEQSSVDAEDPELQAALANGNRRYEERFGRVFLIRAAGRTRAEILAELERRLQLSDATELLVVGSQLREIAMIRLDHLFGQDSA